ncbi:hypothetical protein [Enterocloster citroniae]|uniref:Uncharacterized protein n=1 Tax=[Clostridium] citroniae WAL-17108 TaxID=742733 RepID=G5HEQ3_9FIRM|nr:hypothetical protein [Enterocloster citroniae]EHF00012.1 hypothetical protein HMPREF9469_00926 [ [[Clostridium] citroniae WAL-17108]MCC3383271.1 hypothetical protein [Enterocloster citroniae]
MANKILRFLALGVVFVAQIGTLTTKTFAAEPILSLSIECGTAYDWGSIIVLDNGEAVEISDPPELPDGTRVVVKFADFEINKNVVIDVMELN